MNKLYKKFLKLFCFFSTNILYCYCKFGW